MNEIILTISNLLFGISILTYFYFRELRHKEDAESNVKSIQTFYEKISISKDNLLKEISDKKDKLVHDTFASYLKHIQGLEKQMIQPKDPVMNYLNGSTYGANHSVPPIANPSPNDIEKTEEEMESESFNDIFSKIPITKDTKVMVEGEGLPEEIIA